MILNVFISSYLSLKSIIKVVQLDFFLLRYIFSVNSQINNEFYSKAISLTSNLPSIQIFKQTMINFSELFTCDKTQIYQKLKSQKKYIDTKKLCILVDPEGNILLMMGPVCYGVTNQTHGQYYMFQNNYGPFIILSLENHLHGNYELLVKQNIDLLIACLEQNCQMINKGKQVNKDTPKETISPKKELQRKIQAQKIGEDLQIGLPSTDKDNNYIKMSKSLGNGLYLAAKILSKGITTVGGYIANNIEPSKQIKFSESSKQNLRQVNQWSTQAFEFTSGTVKQIINYGKQMAIDASNQNQSIKKIEQQKVFNDIKNGAVTGIKVFVNLYDGMVQAGDQIKNGAFKGGQQIIKKKYGIQAEQALRHVAGGVNNVVKIYKLPKNSVKYLFKVQKQANKF